MRDPGTAGRVCKDCGEPVEVVGRMNHGRYQGDLVRCGCMAPMPDTPYRMARVDSLGVGDFIEPEAS